MNKTNTTLLVILIIVILGVGAYFLFGDMLRGPETPEQQQPDAQMPSDQQPDQEDPDQTAEEDETQTVLGTSVEGHDIVAYHFGEGDREVLFVGGIHGGYSWNTALLAYQIRDYLEDNAGIIPADLRVTVIPVLNPDGLSEVVGTASGNFSSADVPEVSATISGRFNANNVDLSRNFDCNWQSSGTWQSRQVDAGSEPFSEPEARALRDYINANDIAGAVVYYSAAGGVYTSSCGDAPLVETEELVSAYAEASGYPAQGRFDAYPITGDAVDWLAKMNIPGISVLLTTHEEVEWEENRAGIEAVLEYFATN